MASERMNKPASAWSLIRSRKRVGLAVILATVMGLLWVRVLTGHKPQAASASPAAPQTPATAPAGTGAGANKTPIKVRYLDLPVVPGRNDTIECDFFTGRDWNGFPRSSDSAAKADAEAVPSPADRTGEAIGKAAQKLSLQAVFGNSRPEAYINDQVLQIGGRLSIEDGADSYSFEVKDIRGDSVLVECRGQQVTLKMK